QRRSLWWRKPRRKASYFLAFAAAAAMVIFVVAYRWQQPPAKPLPVMAQASQPTPARADDQKSALISELRANVEMLQGQTERQKEVIAGLASRTRNSETNSTNAKAELAEANTQLARLQSQI